MQQFILSYRFTTVRIKNLNTHIQAHRFSKEVPGKLVFIPIAVGFQQGLGRLFDAFFVAYGVHILLRLILLLRKRSFRFLLRASFLRKQRAEILEKAAIRFLYSKNVRNDNKLNIYINKIM